MAAVVDAEVVVAAAWAAVAETSAEVEELDRRWEALRPSTVALRLLQPVLRHQPRGPMSAAAAPERERVIGRLCNQDHDQVPEQLPVHDQRLNPVLVRVVEPELDRDKGSVPARGPRIVRLRVQDKERRIVWASRNSQRGCRDWEPVSQQVRPPVRWREIAWRIKRRASDKRA